MGYTAEEFEELLKECTSPRLQAALRIAASVVKPGFIEDALEAGNCTPPEETTDARAGRIRSALTGDTGTP